MKICYIGAQGHWQYTLGQLDKNEVAGVCPGFPGEDISPLLNELKSRDITPKVYESYEDMLDISDIAVVNTRFDLNAGITAEFLRKNVYVFSEKPLATTHRQLEELTAAQANSDAFVSAMFGIRYSGWFIALRKAVQKLGRVRMINAQKSYKLGVRPDFYRSRDTFGGLIPWVAIHAIDWVYSVAGEELEVISAVSDNSNNSGNGDLEMTSLCHFKTKSGILASVNADYFRPASAETHDDDRVRVVCTDGVAEYACGKIELIDKDGAKKLDIPPDEDVFEMFIKRINGENVGVTPEESFYITELALISRDLADKENRKNTAENCGLVSVSFRNHSAEEIVNAVKNAGLSYIEWGSDIHVPNGDIETAKHVRTLCEKSKIKISSYGSYYRLGQNQDIMPYILSAKALGAPVIRIWAGTVGSADITPDLRRELAAEAKDVCKKAAEYGLKVDFEYHPDTLTDNAYSAQSLLSEIDEPNCGIYWQPNYEKSFSENISALKLLLPHVDIIHMFFWDEKYNRFFLEDGKAQIGEFLEISKKKNPTVLLEFVPEDNIEYLKSEAQTLFEIVRQID